MTDATFLPPAPLVHADEKEHRRRIAARANQGLPQGGGGQMQAPLRLMSYTVTTLPAAELWADSIVIISNEAGGKVPAFSDGTNWRRVTDRAVAS